MADFFNTYGFLIVSMIFGSILGISVYLPLMAGQLSLATPGFYALGGYVSAILSTKVFTNTGSNYPLNLVFLEMLIAGIISGILAIVLGIPVLRLRGIYLAIATIAWVEILRIIALNLEITGGAVGIFAIPQPFTTQLAYLWLALPLLFLTMLFLYRLENIKIGRAFNAIRADELAAASMGINPTYHKVLSFTFGAVLAAVVGAVSAHFLNTWNSRQGTFDASIIFLAFVLIGGSRTFVGPVVGGIVLTALPEVLRALGGVNGLPIWLGNFLRDGRLIIFGILIVLGTIFYPQGLITPELIKKLIPFKRRSSLSQFDS
ncbi:MAG: branched-chain amino acid ABC transporter permease [Microcystis sp. M53603_WE2]|jgi:branched-chain amino acid transport system permease protein|uniref:Amino acid ABC-transporter permease protein n=1 Tax=Microcystis aeruginosa PCC 9717 TaxID=1160286 RepID=I4FQU9_MICAE|nr:MULTISPECIES: branched-chain amino acid ABC transporter permease [Microcystis]MCE2661821.1 branched-chain amino acid ABC transporter permease [Microcystis sp. 53602_E8]MCZ8363126.1 branched-chain amino acid ABC transporter permease [Microcystis sp. LE19-251.1A]MDJ0528078.1 branched-chain amino acid ABC transporter permease [Microcystis sp. M53600_WE12]MCZ8025469.1 branched-chain amino acid ABC transporter permease [Microcystis sp. LE19-10.1B]MDJ0539751.1 branched-chain amino acid ABC transp